jgi:uncharacterized membrane protein
VIAIIITIMVLELKVPHEAEFSALKEKIPVFLSYVLSFIYIGIYWNNHHHMLHTVKTVRGGILWANLHLLFWLSLVPFATGWMGENHFAPAPMVLYGFNLLMCAVAFTILQFLIVKENGKKDSVLAKAVGKGLKEKLSLVCYIVAIVSAFFISEWIAGILYIFVALIWLIPDKRIEKIIEHEKEANVL